MPPGLHLFYPGRHLLPGCGCQFQPSFEANGIPDLERAVLPAKPSLHRIVNFIEGIGDFRDSVGDIGKQGTQALAVKFPGLVLAAYEYREPVYHIVDGFGFLQGIELGPLAVAVVQGIQV